MKQLLDKFQLLLQHLPLCRQSPEEMIVVSATMSVMLEEISDQLEPFTQDNLINAVQLLGTRLLKCEQTSEALTPVMVLLSYMLRQLEDQAVIKVQSENDVSTPPTPPGWKIHRRA